MTPAILLEPSWLTHLSNLLLLALLFRYWLSQIRFIYKLIHFDSQYNIAISILTVI